MLGGVSGLSAQQARFDQATFLLEQNEYREAVQLYKSIAEDGYESGSLWLNLGISYTHLDSLGMAKFYFLQAAQFPETRELAEEALDFVNERFNRRSAVLPPLPWDRFFQYLSLQVGKPALLWVAFIFLYGSAAILIFSWFYKKAARRLKYTGLVAFLISIIIFATSIYIDYLDNRYGTGVMIERQTSVYEKPDPDTPVVSTAYEGYTLRVDHHQSEEYPAWHYVRLENGMYGWIRDDVVRVF